MLKDQATTQGNLGNIIKTKFFLLIFILGTLLVTFDQITKRVLLDKMLGLPFVTKTCNTGAAFSILQNSNSLLIGISFLFMIVIGSIFYFEKDKKIKLFLSIIMAGAIGNLIDRVVNKCVIDFIDFKIWPIFNIADSTINVGVLLLIIYLISEEVKIYRKKR